MKRCLMIFLISLTTGCAHLNSEFDCPAAKGVGCKRLSAINEEYNEKKGLPNDVMQQNTMYTKSGQEKAYHHPRKVTVKT